MAPLDEGREGRFFGLEEAADLFGEGVMALQGQRGDCLAQQRVEIAEPAHRRELEQEFRQLLITALIVRIHRQDHFARNGQPFLERGRDHPGQMVRRRVPLLPTGADL